MLPSRPEIPDTIELRRRLHRVPELGFLEFETSQVLKKHMAQLGAIRPIGETGFFIDLGPDDAARTILLRADMDGLPVTEETGLSHASIFPGFMHACGHDGHMAALVSAAFRLSGKLPPNLRVRVFFQPAEEGRGGARFSIEQGVLEGVDAAFGLHLWNELPLGSVAISDGGIMASVAEFEVCFRGVGGHGALPQRANNPILAASSLVTALESYSGELGSRGVLSVGSFKAGEAFNVIPETARVTGTARAFDTLTQSENEETLRRLSRSIADLKGIQTEFIWKAHHPVTHNSPVFAKHARDAANRVPGVSRVLKDYRTMAGEDFGEILAEVGGAYALLGSGKEDGTSAPHHSPYFDIDERSLELAVTLHCEVVGQYAADGA